MRADLVRCRSGRGRRACRAQWAERFLDEVVRDCAADDLTDLSRLAEVIADVYARIDARVGDRGQAVIDQRIRITRSMDFHRLPVADQARHGAQHRSKQRYVRGRIFGMRRRSAQRRPRRAGLGGGRVVVEVGMVDRLMVRA